MNDFENEIILKQQKKLHAKKIVTWIGIFFVILLALAIVGFAVYGLIVLPIKYQ